MDSSSREVRTIAAEYTGSDPDAPAINFNEAQNAVCNWITAEWGSIKSYNNFSYMEVFVFPRIYSAGSVSACDVDPTPPNTDNVHYWAYQPDMGSPPVPDLA
jgi:hypothetical protein